MNFSKLFFITIFILHSLFFTSSIRAPPSNSTLFREYIGYMDLTLEYYNYPTFTDVPINPNVDFHFILSFANDYDYNNSSEQGVYRVEPTDGIFYTYWDTNILSPSQVLSIKSQHPNVKVAVSIGGFTFQGRDHHFFPLSVDSWVSNAVSSLTNIVKGYNLDGIDIFYKKFNVDPEFFGSCIGRLISTLKENGVISFASIAPYNEDIDQSHYLELWRNYGHLIDYVNFQFYSYDTKWTSVDQFIDYFDIQSTLYKGGKILASLISDDSGGLTSDKGFFAACNTLRSSRKSFAGIFVWSADISKPKGFGYENQSQAFLATPQY